MASTPYVGIFIDAHSFPYVDELVQDNSEPDVHPVPLENAMRLSIKQHLETWTHEHVDSTRLKVNVFVPAKSDEGVDQMARFKTDLTELQDYRIAVVSTPGEMVQLRKESIEASGKELPVCRFILIATQSPELVLGYEQESNKIKVIDQLPGYIPVNAAHYRVDYEVGPPPPKSSWAEYQRYVKSNNDAKCCNRLHLGDGCNNQECEATHGKITAGMLKCMRFMCLRERCMDGGKCRRITCFFGHACFKEDLTDDKKHECKFKDFEHGIDKEIHHWEKGRLRYKRIL
ncbi:hypothetical protein G6011_05921 [Alternaria panax]|uniref:Tandem CCCH zinc finger domain-containing protein n=1 Tax=Alternaria panax TaxID=48097 RepID=A0AAD4FFJ6_9PLEO|nr:hypothetical protein G6011_05921 [Alternaria panax]